MADLEIQIEGQEVEEAAGLLARALEKELGYKPGLKRLVATDDKETRLDLDPVAVATLLVSIPGAALAAWDLVQRFKKRNKAEKIIKEARELTEARPGLRITISTPGGTTVRLDKMDPNELVDVAIEVEGGG